MSEVTSETTSTPAAAIPVKTSNSHSVQITTIRLNGDNFLRWSQSVRMYIRGQGKIGYITGDKKAPAVNDPLFDSWDAENSMDLDIFNTYEWKSVDDCNHHKKTVEDSRIYKFLAGLNIEFDEVRGRIIGRPPLPSIGEVFAEVRREESRRSVMLKKKGTGESIEISALISDAAANKAANYQRRFDDKPREALDDPNWKLAVMEEMNALRRSGTWEIVDLPKDKKTVGCKWVFTIKCNADGSVERYKARLVAKGFTQTYGIDYQETFAPVAKINSIRVLLSLAVNSDWPLHQLDIKNAFLNGDLEEESQADHTIFYKHSKNSKIAILIVYVDDIILTGNDEAELAALKEKLAKEFHIKDLGALKYFLGMEFARSKEGIFVNQRKYVLDLLGETGMLGCKMVETPIEPNLKLQAAKAEEGEAYCSRNMDIFKLKYTQMQTGQEVLQTGDQHPDTAPLILEELKLSHPTPMKVYCDNKAAISIAHNPVLHDRTKHIEVDKHFIKEKINAGIICMTYLPTGEQLADVLTKGLHKKQFDKLTSKLAMEDIFKPA
ncbi:hypothetical protein CsSME_00040591 [Camellia sinensis var. sinensis]